MASRLRKMQNRGPAVKSKPASATAEAPVAAAPAATAARFCPCLVVLLCVVRTLFLKSSVPALSVHTLRVSREKEQH